jgi:hypothetical protein
MSMTGTIDRVEVITSTQVCKFGGFQGRRSVAMPPSGEVRMVLRTTFKAEGYGRNSYRKFLSRRCARCSIKFT